MPVQPPVSRSLSAADGGSLRRLHELSFRKMSFLAYVRKITKEHQPSGVKYQNAEAEVGRDTEIQPRCHCCYGEFVDVIMVEDKSRAKERIKLWRNQFRVQLEIHLPVMNLMK
uniref:Uncharacterized protein n=1 Tax=Oryza barthii TaxID=65489 RepID=A0A0D3GVD7_9ORYZ